MMAPTARPGTGTMMDLRSRSPRATRPPRGRHGRVEHSEDGTTSTRACEDRVRPDRSASTLGEIEPRDGREDREQHHRGVAASYHRFEDRDRHQRDQHRRDQPEPVAVDPTAQHEHRRDAATPAGNAAGGSRVRHPATRGDRVRSRRGPSGRHGWRGRGSSPARGRARGGLEMRAAVSSYQSSPEPGGSEHHAHGHDDREDRQGPRRVVP